MCFLLLSSQISVANINLHPLDVDEETLTYLFDKARRLSGIENFGIEVVPPLYLVTHEQMNQEVCPETPGQCRNLAAVFDDLNYRILVLEDLKISQNFKPFEYSFLIHEIIHALQYRQSGAEIFKDCQAIYETESLAYHSQDQYLKEEGEFFRPSVALKSFYCDEAEAKGDYLKSKKIWDQRQQEGW